MAKRMKTIIVRESSFGFDLIVYNDGEPTRIVTSLATDELIGQVCHCLSGKFRDFTKPVEKTIIDLENKIRELKYEDKQSD